MDQIGLGDHYSGIYLFASGVNAAGSSLLQRPAPPSAHPIHRLTSIPNREGPHGSFRSSS